MKYVNYILSALILVIGIGSFYAVSEFDAPDKITGSFTEAEPVDETDTNGIKQVYWKFEDGENLSGRAIKREVSPGTYNVTIQIVRTNGEVETYQKEVEIK